MIDSLFEFLGFYWETVRPMVGCFLIGSTLFAMVVLGVVQLLVAYNVVLRTCNWIDKTGGAS